MNKRILITGGAGFIMSHVVDEAIHQGYDVCNVDAMLEGSCQNNLNPKARHVNGYVEDVEFMQDVVRGVRPDLVIHGAALSNVDTSIKTPLEFNYNYVATATLCQVLKEENYSGILVHIGTDEEYGAFDYASAAGAESNGFTEQSKLNPTSSYAVSKVASSLIALSYWKTWGLRVRVTRCSNNYGIRQQDKLIPTIFKKLHQQEKIPIFKTPARRNWLHVEDHVSAMFHVAEHGQDGEVYNVSSNENLSPREIVEIMMGENNANAHIVEVPDRLAYDLVYKINSQKLRNTGWEPKHSIKDQLPNMIQWYLRAYEQGYFANGNTTD